MAAYVGFDQFLEDMANKVHDLSADTLQVALCAPGQEPLPGTHTVLANLTQIAYTNLDAQGLVTTSSTQTSGTYALVMADKVLTASGLVADFQFVVIFNQDSVTPTDALICYYDHGSTVTLSNGETYTIDFAAGGLFTMAPSA